MVLLKIVTEATFKVLPTNDHHIGLKILGAGGETKVGLTVGKMCKEMISLVVQVSLTLLWAYTTDPSSFQVPPLRSIRIMRNICRNRKLRSAEVAKTFPWDPAASTAMEAISTMMSARKQGIRGRVSWSSLTNPHLP